MLEQVEVRCVLRLEDKRSGRTCQREEQHIGGPLGTQVVGNRLDLSAEWGRPGIDTRQEFYLVSCV